MTRSNLLKWILSNGSRISRGSRVSTNDSRGLSPDPRDSGPYVRNKYSTTPHGAGVGEFTKALAARMIGTDEHIEKFYGDDERRDCIIN